MTEQNNKNSHISRLASNREYILSYQNQLANQAAGQQQQSQQIINQQNKNLNEIPSSQERTSSRSSGREKIFSKTTHFDSQIIINDSPLPSFANINQPIKSNQKQEQQYQSEPSRQEEQNKDLDVKIMLSQILEITKSQKENSEKQFLYCIEQINKIQKTQESIQNNIKELENRIDVKLIKDFKHSVEFIQQQILKIDKNINHHKENNQLSSVKVQDQLKPFSINLLKQQSAEKINNNVSQTDKKLFLNLIESSDELSHIQNSESVHFDYSYLQPTIGQVASPKNHMECSFNPIFQNESNQQSQLVNTLPTVQHHTNLPYEPPKRRDKSIF